MEGQKLHFQACRLEFTLMTDLVMSEPVRFDSLMCSLWFASHYDQQRVIPEDVPLPIRKLKINKEWFWDCSHAIYEVRHRQQDTIKKNIDDLNGKLKVDCGSGPYCSVFKKFERMTVDKVWFFAYGDKEELEEHVQQLHCLGGLRKDGFGWIDQVDITNIAMPYCCWDSQTGLLLRDIPMEGLNPFDYLGETGILLRRARCRPPYFKRYSDGVMALIGAGSLFKSFPKVVKNDSSN